MKKSCVFTLIIILILSLYACGPNNDEYIEIDKRISVAMVTDINGFGNDSFNDALLVGLERAKSEFDLNLLIYESANVEDFAPNLSKAAASGANLVISRGFLMADATKFVAENNPDTKFAIIDYGDITADNIATITFNEQEGSFIMGVIAALKTKTNKVGFIGGMQFPTDERYEYGFKAGIKAVKPETIVLMDYTGSVSDNTLCKVAAIKQFEQGADIIFQATEQCKNGIIAAAAEKGFWAIAIGQDGLSENPVVLSTMTKNVENVIYLTIKSFVENEMSIGNAVFGITENGVGYSDRNKNIDPAIADEIQIYKELIKKGKIQVPYDLASFEAYKPPVQ